MFIMSFMVLNNQRKLFTPLVDCCVNALEQCLDTCILVILS